MKKRFVLIICVAILSIQPISSWAQYATISTFAGLGSGGGVDSIGDGLPCTAAKFAGISGLCTDTMGNIYVADGKHARIRKIHAVTHIITCIGGTGTAGYTGDGGPAVLANIGRGVTGLSCNAAGDLFFSDTVNHIIRKINYTTGVISTVVGNGTLGYTGDGGPATAAGIGNVISTYADWKGNLFLIDGTQIRKIDSNGVILSFASIGNQTSITGDRFGNLYTAGISGFNKTDTLGFTTINFIPSAPTPSITWFGQYGGNPADGLPGKAQWTMPNLLSRDLNDNLFFTEYYSYILRKVEIGTGNISSVAGNEVSGYWFTEGMGAKAAILYARFIAPGIQNDMYYVNGDDSTIKKIVNLNVGIRYSQASDTVLSTPCSLADTIGIGIYGIVKGIPGGTDSVTINASFGDSSGSTTFKIPYWHYIDSLGDTVYGYGTHASDLATHVYQYPGTFTPVLHVSTLNNYDYVNYAPAITAGLNCDSGIVFLYNLTVTDTITTLPCTCPHLRTIVSGMVSGTPFIGDSLWLVIQLNSGPIFKKTPYRYEPATSSYYFRDTTGLDFNGGFFYPYALAITTSGMRIALANGHYINAEACGCETPKDSTYGWTVPALQDDARGQTFCVLPYTDNYTISGTLSWYACIYDSVHTLVNFEDGTTGVFSAARVTDGWGAYFYQTSGFSHTYTIPGVYASTVTATAGPFTGTDSTPAATITDACSSVTGIFYIDDNHNCYPDSNETRLSYWTYAIINNVTGDTTYGWTDEFGRYTRSYMDSNLHTIIANPTNALWAMHNTLYPWCPSTGMDTFTNFGGASFARNFGFSCTPLVMMPADTLHDLDMFSTGTAWGMVAGDTGIISVFAGDNWDYICNYLRTSVVLNLDSGLTYLGMWDGPEPDSISGGRLMWDIETNRNLLGLYGNVKVAVSPYLHIGDSVRNSIYVAPTTFNDPDSLNNTFAWTEPVKASWDPNEITVSPRGLDTPGYIDAGTDLTYTIHFQNTGTAVAHNITIHDTLNTNIMVGTIEILNSSGRVTTSQLAPNVVQFSFAHINLPDSGTNLTQSMGYVTYRVSPRAGLAGNEVLTNRAGIYFDTNPCVPTNSTLNTIKDTLHRITGANLVCVGASTSLSDTNAGGTWSCSNSHAAIASDGVLNGISPGYDTIVYTYSFVWGTYSKSSVIYVNPQPDAGTIIGPDAVCVNTLILETDTGGSAGFWNITGGHAQLFAGHIKGLAAGVDTLFYIAENVCDTVFASKIITVRPLPDTGIIVGPDSVCAGTFIIFTDTALGGTWSVGGAHSTFNNDTVTGLTPGIDSIIYTAMNVCDTFTTSKHFTVLPQPYAGLIVTGSSICNGSYMIVSGTVSGGNWVLTGGHSTLVADTISGNSIGTDTIRYSVSNSCGTDVVTKIYDVKPVPAMDAVASVALCDGDRADYVLFSTSIPGTVVNWANDNPSIGLPASGTGTTPVFTGLTDTVKNNIGHITAVPVLDGCAGTAATFVITVSPVPPNPSFALTAANICQNSLFQNFSASNPIIGEEFSWTSTNATVFATGSGGQYSLINFTGEGTAAIVLNGFYSGYNCFSHDTMLYTINPVNALNPEVVYASNSFLCLRNDVDSYQWGYENKITLLPTDVAGEINQTWFNRTPDWNANYYYVKILKDGCMQKAYGNNPLGINGSAIQGQPVVYPNPTTGVVHISLPDNEQSCTISLFDLFGKEIQLKGPSAYNSRSFTIDLGNIARSTYMLKIITRTQTYTEKIVLR